MSFLNLGLEAITIAKQPDYVEDGIPFELIDVTIQTNISEEAVQVCFMKENN